MTAPVATPVAAPVVAPTPVAPVTTPAVPTTPETSTVSQMIQRIAQKVVPDPVAEMPVEPSVTAGPTDTIPPITETPTGTETPTADAAPTIAPTGEVQVDGGDVVMTAERNADGTFKTQLDPSQKFDIKIRDKETGETKVYSKTIPEVLRMAADGVWGQKVKDEVKYYRENVPAWQQTHSTLRADLDAQMALNRELLSAPDEVVIARRTEFSQQMSPENQLARLHAQLQEQQQQQQQTILQQQQTQAANAFVQTRLAPALQNAESLVGPERVAEKLAFVTVPLLVNGQIPPERWGQLEAYVAGPFQEWAKSEAAKSTSAASQADTLRRTQVAAQAVVQRAGAAIRPVGSVGADTAPVAKPKNYQDAIESIIRRRPATSV